MEVGLQTDSNAEVIVGEIYLPKTQKILTQLKKMTIGTRMELHRVDTSEISNVIDASATLMIQVQNKNTHQLVKTKVLAKNMLTAVKTSTC